MKKLTLLILTSAWLIVLTGGCAPAVTSVPTLAPTFTPEPTNTPKPTATATSIPSPTPLPGKVVLPVETLGKEIPWLPLDKTAAPMVNYVGINMVKPPFNSPLIRQAFAYAIDRDVLVEMAKKYHAKNPVPASTLTPPQTLGRDLYGEVGTNFDPQKAKDLLVEAGYTDPSSFPAVTFLVSASGDIAPGARFNMAKAMAEMWQTHLGIKVEVQAIKSFSGYGERLRTNPPDLFWVAWVADYNDPAIFLGELFNPNGQYGGDYNYGSFSNAEFDKLVQRAAKSKDPAKRQNLYIQAERLLTETEVAVIPLFHSTFILK